MIGPECARPKILVFGVTGKFGSGLVTGLKSHGTIVRGLVRKAEQEKLAREAGADEVVIADLGDRPAIEAALTGVDGVFYVPPPFYPDEAETGIWLVDVAKRVGVRRFVFLSAIHPNLSGFANHAAKAPVEEAILNSGLEFVLLQPAMTFQNMTARWRRVIDTGIFAEPWSIETRFSRVDSRDVAEVATMSFMDDRLLYGTFELCGDSRMNRREIAAIMSTVLGRDIRAERTDPAALGSAFDAYQPLFAHYDKHGLLGNALILRAILGRAPRSLEAFLEELCRSETCA